MIPLERNTAYTLNRQPVMKLMIVEDNNLLRENLRLLLEGEHGISVEGAFGSAEEALPLILKIKPDVLLVDIGLPGRSGVELIGDVKKDIPDIEILAHTVFDSRDIVFSALRAGASGYILKGASPREIVEALFNLHEGGAPMSPKIARAVIREFQETRGKQEELLTAREKEILLSLEKGYTYNEIGKHLHISHHTVHTHIKNIYEKLHAKGRRNALFRAKKKGII